MLRVRKDDEKRVGQKRLIVFPGQFYRRKGEDIFKGEFGFADPTAESQSLSWTTGSCLQ